jgi:hypothetical protein
MNTSVSDSDGWKRRPNFFIVGAPKCGTTSVADWLSRNRSVFLTTPKEPHFYSSDLKLVHQYENPETVSR